MLARLRCSFDQDTRPEVACAENGRTAGHKYPQHVVAALAHVAQAKKPLLKKAVAKRWVGCGTTTKTVRLLRPGNSTHWAPRFADLEEAAAMFDKPKLIMREQPSAPSRFLVRQGGSGWMVYDRQRKGPAMLGTTLAVNLMKAQADHIKLLLMVQLDGEHST